MQFVQAVNDPAGKGYVAPVDRVAVFDNDGTLWSEQPVYFQLDEASARNGTVADMKADWKVVYAAPR